MDQDPYEELFSCDGYLLTTAVKLQFDLILKKFWTNQTYVERTILWRRSRDVHQRWNHNFYRSKLHSTLDLRTNQRIAPRSAFDFFFRDRSVDIVPCIHKSGWWPSDEDETLLYQTPFVRTCRERIKMICKDTAVRSSLLSRFVSTKKSSIVFPDLRISGIRLPEKLAHRQLSADNQSGVHGWSHTATVLLWWWYVFRLEIYLHQLHAQDGRPNMHCWTFQWWLPVTDFATSISANWQFYLETFIGVSWYFAIEDYVPVFFYAVVSSSGIEAWTVRTVFTQNTSTPWCWLWDHYSKW